MDEKVYFQAKNTLDLTVDQESMRFIHLVSPLQIVKRLGVCALLYYIFSNGHSSSRMMTLLYIGLVVVSHVATWFQLRNGSASYKNQQDHTSFIIASFLGSHIQLVDPVSQGTRSLRYDDFRCYSETEHLLFLFNSGSTLVKIDKRELCGGTKEQLIEFLHNRCPSLKKKPLNETVGMVLAAAYICTLCVFLALAIFSS